MVGGQVTNVLKPDRYVPDPATRWQPRAPACPSAGDDDKDRTLAILITHKLTGVLGRRSGWACAAGCRGSAERPLHQSLIRRTWASSPMMPRRNSNTQTTKIMPWTTNTHCPIVVRKFSNVP